MFNELIDLREHVTSGRLGFGRLPQAIKREVHHVGDRRDFASDPRAFKHVLERPEDLRQQVTLRNLLIGQTELRRNQI